MKTTIQISEELRRKLKIISSYRDIPYEDALGELIEVFEWFIPFKDVNEFSGWFERNLGRFGLARVEEKKDEGGWISYLVRDEKKQKRKIALQIICNKGDLERFKAEGFDTIVCTFSKEKSQVIRSVSGEVFDKYSLLKNSDDKTTEIRIPKTIEGFFREKVKTTGFSSTSDYITYILRQVVANYEKKEEGKLSEEEKEKVRENLRGLGYLQ